MILLQFSLDVYNEAKLFQNNRSNRKNERFACTKQAMGESGEEKLPINTSKEHFCSRNRLFNGEYLQGVVGD